MLLLCDPGLRLLAGHLKHVAGIRYFECDCEVQPLRAHGNMAFGKGHVQLNPANQFQAAEFLVEAS